MVARRQARDVGLTCRCHMSNIMPDMPDANTTLNQSYALFINLVNITYQSVDQYLPSTHSWLG